MVLTAKRISRLLASANRQQLKSYLSTQHPADIAAAITRLRPEDILNVIETVGNHTGLEVFSNLEKDTQRACIESADPERVISFFEHLSADEQVDLLKLLSPEAKESVLGLLKRSEREDLMRLVRFEEGTAGSAMTTDFFALRPEITAGQALAEIRRRYEEAETIYTIYVTDDHDRLKGVASLKDLVLSPSDRPISNIMNPNVISVTVEEDVELVAKKIARYDLLALPVVNLSRELKGIITVDDVIDIIEEETTEDIYALGAAGAPIAYLSSSVFNIARQRITWLTILIFSGFFAGIVLKMFHRELDTYVQLAFFVPLLMGSAGNAGTQTITVIVRGLATGEISGALLTRVLFKEMRIGLLIGIAMGFLAAAFIFITKQETSITNPLQMAITVAASMTVAVTMAKSIGSMLPILFKRLNLDPALMSGPFLASMLDVMTIFVYLTIARLILPGI